MTTKHLPKAIKNQLASLIQELNCENAHLEISLINNSEIGSSCLVSVSKFRFFVKFLSGDYAQAVTYFNNEVTFYGEIVQQCGGESLTCVPKCYSVGFNDPPFVIMEELQGYAPLEVGVTLSLDMIGIILEQLGRFHASTFANRCDDATSKLKETLFTLENKSIFVSAMHDAFRLLKKSLPENSIYIERFSQFLLGVFDEITDLLRDEDYRVVTHGDLWPNNILWNSQDNLVKFVDFQACRYSSPVHDLMLLLLTGMDKKSRELHFDQLITRYHTSFCLKLEKFGLDPMREFPLSILQQQINKHTKVAMGVALMGLPLFYKDQRVVINENEKVSDFFQRLRQEKSLKCKSKMLEIIMDCIDLGCL